MACKRRSPLNNASPYLRLRRDLRRPISPAPVPSGVQLVPFTPAIAPACRELMNTVYAAGFGEIVPFDRWWPALQADAEYDPTLCFVAADGRDIIGFCHSWSVPFVKDIVVAEAWRGRGVAAALLTTAMRTFVARGATSIDLKTDIDNLRAQAPYLRLGFEIVERVG